MQNLSQQGFRNAEAMGILKTHHVPDSEFSPNKASTACICMHATGLTNPSTTTGSMVAELRKNGPHTIWLTGTSMPCLSIYIPFFLGTDTLEEFQVPTDKPDDSLWWQAEKLHQWICKDYQNRKVDWQEETERMQNTFLQQEHELISANASLEVLEEFSTQALFEVQDLYENFLAKI